MSPYTYCFNNPVMFIDPDGREGIVVSGQPGNHKNREYFLVNGLDRSKKLQNQYNKEGQGEGVTWMVYNGGGKGEYDEQTLKKY